jgi:hypothetical protein
MQCRVHQNCPPGGRVQTENWGGATGTARWYGGDKDGGMGWVGGEGGLSCWGQRQQPGLLFHAH